MSEPAKHTSGPWRAEADHTESYGDRETVPFIVRNDEWIVAAVIGDVEELEEEAPANARLIAAAPDLLAALKGFNITASNMLGGTSDSLLLSIPLTVIQAAAAAIAKAEALAIPSQDAA